MQAVTLAFALFLPLYEIWTDNTLSFIMDNPFYVFSIQGYSNISSFTSVLKLLKTVYFENPGSSCTGLLILLASI